MRSRPPESALGHVTRSLYVVAAVTGLAAAVLLLRAIVSDRQVMSDRAAIQATERDLRQMNIPKSAPTPSAPKAYEASGILERDLKETADAKKCQLTEFKASPDVSNYISLYRREAPDAGWKQSQVHFSVEGTLSGVVDTLQCLEISKVPVEIDSVNLSRLAVGPGGKATVSAQVQLRAIWKDG